MNKVIRSIHERRSIRKYQDESIPRKYIDEILEAGRAAPSAKNRQPWKYIVFGGGYKKDLLMAMEAGLEREERGMTNLPKSQYGIPDARNTLRIMREAPVIIIILNTNARSPFMSVDNDGRIAEICDTLSIGASVENMLLAAEELGLGTLWVANTCFAYQEIVSYLDTKDQLVGAIAVGYADEKPPQRPRKQLEEIAEYRW